MSNADILEQVATIEKEAFGEGGVNLETLTSVGRAFKEGLITIKDKTGDVCAVLAWEKHLAPKYPQYNHDWAETHDEEGKLAYISVITVKKKYRGRGYGSKLLENLEILAKKHGCTQLYCPVNKKHPYLHKGVMDFWTKNGFEIIDEVDWMLAPGKVLSSFVFAKDI